MPAIVGTVNINTASGVFNIGDVQIIAPRSFDKTFAGGGSFNAGEKLLIQNAPSIINIYESDDDPNFYSQYLLDAGQDDLKRGGKR
ncbi:MAG: spore germination protein [Bacillaceae bacterium]|nr:spore germination protein [Bacillaceae bacterium]